jgi:hypothetical protein
MTPYERRCLLQLLRELEVPVPNIKSGRPRKLTPEQEAHAVARLVSGEKQGVVAKDLGVGRQTLCRLMRRVKQSKLVSNTGES